MPINEPTAREARTEGKNGHRSLRPYDLVMEGHCNERRTDRYTKSGTENSTEKLKDTDSRLTTADIRHWTVTAHPRRLNIISITRRARRSAVRRLCERTVGESPPRGRTVTGRCLRHRHRHALAAGPEATAEIMTWYRDRVCHYLSEPRRCLWVMVITVSDGVFWPDDELDIGSSVTYLFIYLS